MTASSRMAIRLAVAFLSFLTRAAGGNNGVEITKQDTGAFRCEAAAYVMVIGPDGNVRDLRVGGTAVLDHGPDGESGAFFLDGNHAVVGFSRVERQGANELLCTDGNATLRYTFLEDRVEIRGVNRGDRYANWAWLPSPHVTRSLDALHDGAIDLVKPPFDGYQADARWLTDSGVVVHMPYITWVRREKAVPGRNVALLSRHYGSGGELPFVIRPVASPRAEDALVFHIQCENPDFLVPAGTTELFSAGVENASTKAFSVSVRFRVFPYLDRKRISSVDTPLHLAGGQHRRLPLTAALESPGVYRGELVLRDGDRALRRLEWVFAYDWEHWNVPCDRPPDFTDFWQSTLQELRTRPLDAVIQPQPDWYDQKVYKVSFRSIGNGRVHGWYIVPPGDGPFPASLFLPGNGVYPIPTHYKGPAGRHALLVIQVHGYDMDLSDYPVPPDPPPWEGGNYWAAWESRDKAFARVVYANCVRAVDFLMSRPEVNKDEVYVEGGSQGGGLALVTAALCPDIKGACIESPGLCRLDWVYRHFLDAPFPWNGNSPKPAGMSDKEFLRVMSYYDVANLVPDIGCPITALIPLQDSVTLGGNGLAALRNLTAPLTLVNGVWADHRTDERMNQARLDWRKRTVTR